MNRWKGKKREHVQDKTVVQDLSTCRRECFTASGFRCLFRNHTAMDGGHSSKKQVHGCQGLGRGLRVQTRPEEGTATCPKIKPKADPESGEFALSKDWEAAAMAGNLQSHPLDANLGRAIPTQLRALGRILDLSWFFLKPLE